MVIMDIQAKTVEACYQGQTQQVDVPENCTVEALLKTLKINPETVVVSKNKTIVADTETLKPGDRVDIIRIISGG